LWVTFTNYWPKLNGLWTKYIKNFKKYSFETPSGLNFFIAISVVAFILLMITAVVLINCKRLYCPCAAEEKTDNNQIMAIETVIKDEEAGGDFVIGNNSEVMV
jgi:hypothetical protein